jgi:hypothetical protein
MSVEKFDEVAFESGGQPIELVQRVIQQPLDRGVTQRRVVQQ